LRVADVGGWTDTWFAHHGRVVSLAVEPGVEVELRVQPVDGPSRIRVETLGQPDYAPPVCAPWGPHPVLEAAAASVPLPEGVAVALRVHSRIPPGAGTGTSAAVAVAVIGALDALTPGRLSPVEVARAAQRVETDLLHRQCGVQDQIAAAFGGICDIAMSEYPNATTSPLPVPEHARAELEARLCLVYLGRSHDSSALHEQVIRDCAAVGPEHPALAALRRCAAEAAAALRAGDLVAYGRALVANTEAQAALHPALVGPEALRVLALAREHGAIGYKVNGAGGPGGSMTLLADADPTSRARLLAAIAAADPLFQAIPVRIARHGFQAETLPGHPEAAC
jgi:D-glycero-alpha-D-manno-heptose-7-phosphate kinase